MHNMRMRLSLLRQKKPWSKVVKHPILEFTSLVIIELVIVGAVHYHQHLATKNAHKTPFNFMVPIDSLHAYEEAYAFLAADLGLDPDINDIKKMSPKPATPEDLLSSLRIKSSSAGAPLIKKSLDDVMRWPDERPWRPLLTFFEARAPFVLIGRITFDRDVFFQAICGKSNVILLARQDLEKAGFTEFFCASGPDQSVRVMVGTTTLLLDKIWLDLGDLEKRGAQSKATFTISNTGRRTVFLEDLATSCGCTVATLGDKKKIPPGESAELLVKISTNGINSLRSIISLEFREDQTGARRVVPLEVLGSRWPTIVAKPDQLDFGTLKRGMGSVTRYTMVKETALDPIRKVRVGAGSFPGTYDITKQVKPGGLTEHLVSFTLDADTMLDAGSHESVAFLHVNNEHKPRIRIPIRFHVPPFVQAVPGTAVFSGGGPNGSKQRIELVSVDNKPLTAEVVDKPSGWDVQLGPARAHNHAIDITICPPVGTMFLHETVTLEVTNQCGQNCDVMIPCVGIGGP